MNLFWSTRRLTEAWEDHLTEFFAAALVHVPSFRQAYADLVVAPFARKSGWPAPVIDRIDTQAEYPGTGCRPDMVLYLAGGKVIACEHKLEAAETFGSEDDRGQLERYLELPIDGLVYVRRAWQAPSELVTTNPRYIRPTEREHYLWYDFFQLLTPGQHMLVDWLREGFEGLGYTPPNPNVGELKLRSEGEERRAMEDFAKLWGRVRTSAMGLGWTVQSGATIQLYLMRNPRSSVAQVFISPESRGGFLVRFTPAAEDKLDAIRLAVTSAAARLPVTVLVSLSSGSWSSKKVKVVDVRATRDAVLGTEEVLAEELELRLLGFVEPLVRAVSGGHR
jgi:hypothetical protein